MFTFVKEYENIGLHGRRAAAGRARENPAGVRKQSRRAATDAHIKDMLLEIHEQITQRWQTALANEAAGQIARDYLAKRGVSAEAVKLFRLGYAPELWDDTVNWAKSKGHELAVVEKAGLIIQKEGSDRYYDRFRGRLMFPICDEQGAGHRFQRTHLDRRRKDGEVCQLAGDADLHQGQSFLRPR